MSEMKEVVIDSVRVSLMSPQRLVVLRQVDEDRFVPIWVGPFEAEAITVALQEIEMVRPLTHDLLKNVFTKFNAKIIRVEIVSLREEIFFGNIVVDVEGKEIHIDSRPSDAIALSVRAHVPIFVHQSVLDTAGMTPENNMQISELEGSEAPPPEEGPDRLSIFEDFIGNLDLDKLDDQEDADSAPDDKKT